MMLLRKEQTQSINTVTIIILVSGIVVGLVVTALMTGILMQPSGAELIGMVSQLATSSVGSVAVGFFVYYAIARRSPSLSLSLAFAYAWTAVLVSFNVWNGARLMFFEAHDFTLAIILLVFAAIIATSFGISVTSRAANDLRNLSRTADRVAAGDLAARARVEGQDEVARMARSFNEMAEKLQAAEQQRSELDQLRRDLIAWTSHDLRTPLTSIRAMVEALNDGLVTDDGTIKRYYRTISQDIVALNSLLDDLFELAQLEAGGIQFEMMPHSLSDIVSDSLEQFHALAAKQNIQIDGVVGDDLDPVILNAAKISRVLGNLIGNALHYTPTDGRILVTAERLSPDRVRVCVQDSGAGFKPEDLSRVFEQFYRGEQSRSRATGGAGLGLSIARGIVEAHQGVISADNAADGGAIVAFELPS